MKGITQSYYLYDSVLYKNLKLMVRLIQSEMNQTDNNESKEVLLQNHNDDTRQW